MTPPVQSAVVKFIINKTFGELQEEALYLREGIQRVPAIRRFWDLKKTALREIHVSLTVGGPLLTQKSPTCTYISQKPRKWDQ